MTPNNAAETRNPGTIEFEPPLACVRRILKNTLPSSTNVGKDASAAYARAAGIFVIYITACANDFARENRRQTITANDVLAAIKELDFDEFTPQLLSFLENYRSAEKTKRESKAKIAAAKASVEGSDADEEEIHENGTPKAKRQKRDRTSASKVDDDDDNGDDEVEDVQSTVATSP